MADYDREADEAEIARHDAEEQALIAAEAEKDQERADTVRDAQNMIFDAIHMIEQAIRGHSYEDNWDAYVVAHLKILAGSNHGYLSRDTNLDDVIRKLEGRTDEEDW